jgi:hypothetical protein
MIALLIYSTTVLGIAFVQSSTRPELMHAYLSLRV